MRVSLCAALIAGSLVAVPVAAQTPPAPTAAPQAPAEEIVRGPKLGSPDVFKPPEKPREGVTMPRMVEGAKPPYTATAMRAGVQGVVKMDAVVLTDGTVGDVKVTQGVDPDLDKDAVTALSKWIFKPGTVDGKVVPFQVGIEMSFTLRGKPPGH